jgi:hypothetical protein
MLLRTRGVRVSVSYERAGLHVSILQQHTNGSERAWMLVCLSDTNLNVTTNANKV